jgi:hypothetical protein
MKISSKDRMYQTASVGGAILEDVEEETVGHTTASHLGHGHGAHCRNHCSSRGGGLLVGQTTLQATLILYLN